MTKSEFEILENIKASNEHLPQTLAALQRKANEKGLSDHTSIRPYISEGITDKKELSPLTVNFRGKWLVDYIKQLVTSRKNSRDKKPYERAIKKTIPEVRKDWIQFCQVTGHPELEDKWEDVYQLIPKKIATPKEGF